MSNKSTPENGDEVRDLVSGMTGIVISTTRFLNGCRRVCVQSPVNDDNALKTEGWFDDSQVEVITKGKVRGKPASHVGKTGGERLDHPQMKGY